MNLAKAEEDSKEEKQDTETTEEKKTEDEDKLDVPLKKNNEKQESIKPKIKAIKKEPGTATENKTDLQRTIVLTGLTSKVKRKAFRLLCEKFGEVEKIVFPVPERSDVTAFVRFKDYKSTIRALQKIPGLKVKKSNVLAAALLTKEGKFPSKKTLDKSRLIVRNLSFKVEEDELKEAFAKFGKVMNVSIPTKTVNDKPVKIGCGFVQFDNPAQGQNALKAMNMKEIKGRTVIVDWALKKEEYLSEKGKMKGICTHLFLYFSKLNHNPV